MADINLLQNQLKDTTEVSKKRTQLVSVISFVVLVLLVAVNVLLYLRTKSINTEVGTVTAENVQLQAEITNGSELLTQAQAYQAQLSNLDLLLDSHIAITPLMQELSNYTYQRTIFTGIDIDHALRRIHLEGRVDNYEGLGKLLLGLSTSPNFSNVELRTVVAANDEATNGFNFSIDMNAVTGLFVFNPSSN